MVFLLNFIVAFIATVAFAKLFHAPDNELIICGISGGIFLADLRFTDEYGGGWRLCDPNCHISADCILPQCCRNPQNADHGILNFRHFSVSSGLRDLLHNLSSHHQRECVIRGIWS